MICIISGTNRPSSRSLEVSQIVKCLFEAQGAECEILDLSRLDFSQLDGHQYSEQKPEAIQSAIEKVNQADGLYIVCPEYNGSYPGILKYFIDHWSYPLSFESRPVAFAGLGGKFGGLRPVEHLQGVFGYRNAYIFPERIFLSNIWSILKDGKILDESLRELLSKQVRGFIRFVQGLQSQNLDANSRLQIESSQ